MTENYQYPYEGTGRPPPQKVETVDLPQQLDDWARQHVMVDYPDHKVTTTVDKPWFCETCGEKSPAWQLLMPRPPAPGWRQEYEGQWVDPEAENLPYPPTHPKGHRGLEHLTDGNWNPDEPPC